MTEVLTIDMASGMLDGIERKVISIGNNMKSLVSITNQEETAFDSLNRKVSQFDEAIDKGKNRLNDFTNQTYSLVIRLVDQVTPLLTDMKSEIAELVSSPWDISIHLADTVSSAISDIKNNLNNLDRGIQISSNGSENSIVSLPEYTKEYGGKSSDGVSSSLQKTFDKLNESTSKVKKNLDSVSFVSKQLGGEDTSKLVAGVLGKFGEKLGNLQSAQQAASGSVIGNMGGVTANKLSKSISSLSNYAKNSPAAFTAGVGGAVVAGATLVSAYGDFKTARSIAEEDPETKAAYEASGTAKVAGTALGAGIGFAIAGPLGAAVGAGIGGWLGGKAGDRIVENREEEKAAEILANEQSKFKSQSLKDALADENVTAEQFNAMFQQAVIEDMRSRFDGVKWDLKDIQTLAQEITFDGAVDSLNKFLDTSAQAEASLAELNNSYAGVDKMNWKAGLQFNTDYDPDTEEGAKIAMALEFTAEDMENYQIQLDQMVQNAKSFVEDKQYEMMASLDVFMDEADSIEFITKANEVYAGIQSTIAENENEIKMIMDAAIEVGEGLSEDDLSKIMELQENIKAETDKILNAENQASEVLLKAKYGGADMDLESFQQFHTELYDQLETGMEAYDEAFKARVSNIELMYAEGAINKSKYNEMMNEAIGDYQFEIGEMKARVENIELDVLAENYADQLDMVGEQFGNTAREKLENMVQTIADEGINPAQWDAKQVEELFGIPELEGAEALVGLGSLLAEMLNEIPGEIAENVDIDGGELLQPLEEGLNEAAESMDMSGFGQTLSDLLKESITENIDAIDGIALILAENVTTFLNTHFLEVGKEVGPVVADNISNSISDNASNVQAGCDAVRAAADGFMQSAFSKEFEVSTTVNITATYKLNNPNVNLSGSGNVSGTVSLSVGKLANGDIVNGRRLTWVGEEGPEAIIPLVPGRRKRGLELWQKAGQMLGVGQYAEGGIVGGLTSFGNHMMQSGPVQAVTEILGFLPQKENDNIYGSESSEYGAYDTPVHTGEGAEITKNVEVKINMNPKFEISGGEQNEGDIVNLIRRHMKEMADDLGGEIALNLEKVFSNMPLKEA